MYVPPHFEEARSEQLQALIRAHPLGALVVQGPDGLDANHLPFELDASGDGPGRLLAHVARANPLWRDAKDGAEALVIFRGADAYISPNWYPSKHESHRQVPTWNYQVVHVHGRLRIRDDERFVRGLVARLTRTHEAQTGAPKPWRMSESAPEFIAQMLAAIVGIEIEIVRMTGKWKLGQNRETRDRVSAALALQRLGHDEIAAAMLAAGN
jgi:transcriptional regulator